MNRNKIFTKYFLWNKTWFAYIFFIISSIINQFNAYFFKFSIVLPKALLFISWKKYFSKQLESFFFFVCTKVNYFFNQSDCLSFTILRILTNSILSEKYKWRLLWWRKYLLLLSKLGSNLLTPSIFMWYLFVILLQ